MPHAFTIEDLFRELEGKSFTSYQEFDAAVRKVFMEHRSSFPLGYTPRQAISWARRHRWVTDAADRLNVHEPEAA